MKIEGKVAVITGGASGIGRELARRFKAEGAAGIVVADVQEEALVAVAEEVGGLAVVTDVTKESEIQTLVERAENEVGPIDIFCSNAGIARLGDVYAPNDEWLLNWDIHVMAHVYAARLVAPKMAARGDGYLVNTASAAGLLSHVGSATYAVTKHAAVSFAEWLSIEYGTRGVKVSVFARSGSHRDDPRPGARRRLGRWYDRSGRTRRMRRADHGEGRISHPAASVVLKYIQGRAGDYDRWLGGMRKLKERYRDNPGI